MAAGPAAFSYHRRSQHRKICLGLRNQRSYQHFSHNYFWRHSR